MAWLESFSSGVYVGRNCKERQRMALKFVLLKKKTSQRKGLVVQIFTYPKLTGEKKN